MTNNPQLLPNMSCTKFKPINIVFVVYPGIKLLDLTGPLQVFADAKDENDNKGYQISVCSIDGGTVSSDTILSIPSKPISILRRRRIDTLIVVGGNGVFDAIKELKLVKLVNQLASRSRRVGAVCTGAFLLAECGLLNGRSVATHWDHCNKLQDSYPKLKVKADSIFSNDGIYWTSAGVTAGIDMSLKMISDDLGRTAALELARSLVTFLVRPGGQSQFSQLLSLQSSDSTGRFDELHHWIQNNLTKNLQNQQLADRVYMSARNFARVYLSETGNTPAKAVESIRVEAACRMLIESNLKIVVIARRCGFTNDEGMRRAFSRQLNVLPENYRSRFS